MQTYQIPEHGHTGDKPMASPGSSSRSRAVSVDSAGSAQLFRFKRKQSSQMHAVNGGGFATHAELPVEESHAMDEDAAAQLPRLTIDTSSTHAHAVLGAAGRARTPHSEASRGSSRDSRSIISGTSIAPARSTVHSMPGRPSSGAARTRARAASNAAIPRAGLLNRFPSHGCSTSADRPTSPFAPTHRGMPQRSTDSSVELPALLPHGSPSTSSLLTPARGAMSPDHAGGRMSPGRPHSTQGMRLACSPLARNTHWEAPGWDMAAVLTSELKVLCKMDRCANHVFICQHPLCNSQHPPIHSFIVKFPRLRRKLMKHRKTVFSRHLPLITRRPPPELFVTINGYIEGSMNELNVHSSLRTCMEPDRQDEPCLFMVLERLPGTLLDFWLQFEERRYCVFTATSFLRDLLRVCLWLEENSLYLYDFKLENFFVRADGRLVLGDLDTVFAVQRDPASGRIWRNHSRAVDGIYGSVDCHKMPFQSPEVRAACERLGESKQHAEQVQYGKAHAWSCASLIHYFLSSTIVPNDVKCSDKTTRKMLLKLGFLYRTNDSRTDNQGLQLVTALSKILVQDPASRPSTTEALALVEAAHGDHQFKIDFGIKYKQPWGERFITMLQGKAPSGNPILAPPKH